MNKNLTFFLLSFFLITYFSLTIKAQKSVTPTTQPFGKIDKADLEMTDCDFEKGANAEILFDKGTVFFDAYYRMTFERHIRIKIFKDIAKNEGIGNVKIQFTIAGNSQSIENVEAQTINLKNNVIEYSKVDKKTMFRQNIDRQAMQLAFSFPNVQAGSIIEYKYTLTSRSFYIPEWYFQSDKPTRYSELNTSIPNALVFKNLEIVNQPFLVHTDETKSMANIASFQVEPFTSSRRDNAEHIKYQISNFNIGVTSNEIAGSWKKVGENMVGYDNFGGQFKRKLTGEETIIAKVKTINSSDKKIEYIFNEVKNDMKWNGINSYYTSEGISEAWDKKTETQRKSTLFCTIYYKNPALNRTLC